MFPLAFFAFLTFFLHFLTFKMPNAIETNKLLTDYFDLGKALAISAGLDNVRALNIRRSPSF